MRRSLNPILTTAAMSVCAAVAACAEQRVTITGDRDGSGQNFEWTVVNLHASPIVWVEFPHYHADTFITPAGWKQECTNLEREGSKNLPGLCRGRAESPEHGIARGSPGKFGMRIALIGTEKGRGTVTVKFSDGTIEKVSGVVLPVAPGFFGQFLPAIAMGGLFLAAFLIHALRKRRADRAGPLEPT